MKRVLLMLAATAAFALAAGAQANPSAASSSAVAGKAGTAHHQKGTATENTKKMGAKTRKLTGCISASPESDGMYMLTNGRYKKGIEVGPTDKVQDNAGKKVALTGTWATSAEMGETSAASSKEKGEHHFEVENVKQLSGACTMQNASTGTMHHHKKNKGTGSAAATPPPSR